MFDSVNTAAQHIFHERYRVLIPRHFMYSAEYIRKVGYGASGNAGVDRMASSNLEAMNQTIAGLAILHFQGAELLLLDENDCVPIYKAIVRHLVDWRDFSSHGLNPDQCPPIEDFRALEEIAIQFHIRAQELEPIAQPNSRLWDAVQAMNRSASRMVWNRTQSRDAEGSIKPYLSIVDDIEKNLLGD